MKKKKSRDISVRVGRISYINVAPVYYGIDRQMKPDWVELITAPPADLNRQLQEGLIDISPVSSAAYAFNHEDWLLLPDLSISSFGKVMSVILVSRYELNDLHSKTVFLSEESASAASLVRYIMYSEGCNPNFIPTRVTSPDDVSGADAALVIGDAALTENWQGAFRYVYDLGDLWKQRTGLPFVFAVWAIRKKIANAHPELVSDLYTLFMASKKQGKANYYDIIKAASMKTGLDVKCCETYFDTLHCDLNEDHIKGLDRFFKSMLDCGLIPNLIHPCFQEIRDKR